MGGREDGRIRPGAERHSGHAQRGRSAHGDVLHAAIWVVAEFSGLEQLPDESLQVCADAAQGVVTQFAAGCGIHQFLEASLHLGKAGGIPEKFVVGIQIQGQLVIRRNQILLLKCCCEQAHVAGGALEKGVSQDAPTGKLTRL